MKKILSEPNDSASGRVEDGTIFQQSSSTKWT
jgi:hypothetical protein